MAASKDDELIGCCTECKSEQRDSYMEKNPFYQQGGSVPCQYCSGVTVVVARKDKEKALKQRDGRRNLY